VYYQQLLLDTYKYLWCMKAVKNSMGQRIKALRTQAGLTQQDLATKVGMTYIQIGRYEARGAMPSSETLSKIANVLNTTSDYLMNGLTDEQATKQIKDKELLGLFKSIEELTNKDKEMVKLFLGALVTKRQLQKISN